MTLQQFRDITEHLEGDLQMMVLTNDPTDFVDDFMVEVRSEKLIIDLFERK